MFRRYDGLRRYDMLAWFDGIRSCDWLGRYGRLRK